MKARETLEDFREDNNAEDHCRRWTQIMLLDLLQVANLDHMVVIRLGLRHLSLPLIGTGKRIVDVIVQGMRPENHD